MDFKALREEILEELLGYYPITESERFYLDYLTAFAKVLQERDLNDFGKDLIAMSKDPYVSYSFQVFLKKLRKLIEENVKIE